MNPWIGWSISTLLLLFLNRKNKSSSDSDTSQQQPSKFTESNVNSVGNPVPVVLGRGMIKNPMISFYGGFRADPYTEEYGMHSDVDASNLIWPLLLGILAAIVVPNVVVGPMPGTEVTQGAKNTMIVMAILNVLISLLMMLFNEHGGRTTIQKGFKYYLGWQHIICWTGDNFGIKKLWMNVYNSDVEASTEVGVWDNNNHVAWKADNMSGIVANIDDEDMFGGVDEGGGFVGQIRFYFGNRVQANDTWMIRQMLSSSEIPEPLRGITPKYPMYFTCVVSNPDTISGAYIGKQATIPEMWFEVVNYPMRLSAISADYRHQRFRRKMAEHWQTMDDFMATMDASVQAYMRPYIGDIKNSGTDYINGGPTTIAVVRSYIDTARNAFPPTDRHEFYNATEPLYRLFTTGVWNLGRLGDDLNPAEAIYEILMNDYWGCNYRDSRVDVNSLIDLGCTCEEEGLGVSCVIDKTAEANDYVTKILNHINGVKYDNPMTGKLTFKLIRGDYNINNLKSFDISNCESCEYSRLDWSETTSSISLSFTDADNKYDIGQFSQNDIANRLITGSYTEKSVDGEYFTTTSNARWLAQNSALSAGYPLAAINLVTNRVAYDVTVGDPIKVNWEPYGISQMVFRVTDIDYATLTDGKISITAIEDVFGFEKLDFEFSSTPAWTDPEKEPYEVARFLFLEYPYELARCLDSYMYAFAPQPSNYTVYWNVWRYKGGTYSVSSNSSKWSMVGRMTYGYPEAYEFDEIGFEFSPVGENSELDLDDKVNAINSDPYRYNHNSSLNLVVVDDEIMSYDSIVKLPNGHYQMKGVVRGVFDTLPKEHSSESIIFFLDYGLNVNGTSPVAMEGTISNEQLEIKTATTDKTQDFDLDDIVHYATTRRTEQPTVMANLKFGADKGTETTYLYNYPSSQIFSNDILFKFIGRNKFNSYGILEQTDDSNEILVSEGTKNVLLVSCNGEEFEYKYDALEEYDSDGDGVDESHNVTSMRLKWVDFCRELNNKVSETNAVSVTIKTYDSIRDVYSYDEYNKSLNYTMPRLAGILTPEESVQDYANTLVNPELNNIILPATRVSPQLTLTFEDCALIFIGSVSTDIDDVTGQDGQKYALSTQAYRIDGCDSSGNAIIHPITIEEEFIFRTNYTSFVGNYSDYYRYRASKYLSYTPYVPS